MRNQELTGDESALVNPSSNLNINSKIVPSMQSN
ncbi:hypothetical protein NIES2109_27250 [Nostoc sp. HK-01]|nr:hypothetical protein NIES2109_27250 [Nostoc sp. HK-01]